MDLLHCNKFYHPEIGGIEQVVRATAEGMARRGHANRVLVAVPRGRGASERVGGVPVTRTASLGVAKSVPLSPTYPPHLGRASRSADVVHHHLPNPLSVVSQLATPSTDAAVVATYHSDIVRQRGALRLYRPLLHRFLDALDHVFVTSPPLLERSAHLAPYREKASVVPLSIDLDDYGRRVPAVELPGRADRPTLLFVGRLNYYKGVEYLLDAMPALDADLLVAGSGERRRELEARADRLGVDDRVFFLGRVGEDRLHACYDRADVFVLPSVEPSEAFGIVQLEAMAYGTPVVNTDLPTGVPWVSRDGDTGVTVPPRDADALATAIDALLADAGRRRTYGQRARERVERRFGRERMLDTLEAAYRALVDEGSDAVAAAVDDARTST
ncbi:glycosyltransferase [Haloplanus halophilus]|uniref:glycosyltransferase n=1 Tax=Haloplanus halophilus TaxID=2949993 RepID=UPI00203C51EF|nr:glycosyltransferase [Haloplanus sp. GDY1]